ncbi:hypothetical protein SBA4_2730004 [Candidatus Sulfopaludibacter sp. SbA4]|nr:hypothetical protein SBA4_2730004 [Candidatus Sulfopaludibacter sp. SbA4]
MSLSIYGSSLWQLSCKSWLNPASTLSPKSGKIPPNGTPSRPKLLFANPAHRPASGPTGPFYPQCKQLNLQPKLNKWLRLLKSHKSLHPSRAASTAAWTPTTAPSIPSCALPNPARQPASGPRARFIHTATN